MEQKKTLWIIAAVGTFLLVVLGTAGILYSPSKNSNTEITKVAASSNNEKNKNNNGWKTESTDNVSDNPIAVDNSENPKPQHVDEMVVVSNNTTIYDLNKDGIEDSDTTTIDLNALKSELNPPAEATSQAPVQPQNNINVNVTVPENNNGSNKVVKAPDFSSDDDYSSKITSTSTSKVSEPKKTEKVTAPKTQNKSQPKAQTAKASKPVAAPKKEAPKKVTQFWVQVASYSNKKGAENAKSILDDNKISSDIFTYEDKKDDLYYRVRIGPYTTKSEAEYWKARVLKIDYFKNNDSYITSTVK